jgi:hypothetical protein
VLAVGLELDEGRRGDGVARAEGAQLEEGEGVDQPLELADALGLCAGEVRGLHRARVLVVLGARFLVRRGLVRGERDPLRRVPISLRSCSSSCRSSARLIIVLLPVCRILGRSSTRTRTMDEVRGDRGESGARRQARREEQEPTFAPTSPRARPLATEPRSRPRCGSSSRASSKRPATPCERARSATPCCSRPSSPPRRGVHYEASHDALTGQPNRVLFLDRLSQRIEREKHGRAARCAMRCSSSTSIASRSSTTASGTSSAIRCW